MLELSVAVSILGCLILYALMGGADFGGGIWDLLATGPRATQQRKVIAEAIGPIWEANHVWLILVIVVLFSGFPTAFTSMMTALNIPVTAMLVGIVLRGSAFVFRTYDTRSPAMQRRWSVAFGLASVCTPFFQGMILGATASGQIRVTNGQVNTGYFSGWLTPFAFSCGLFALGLFSFLASSYLTLDARDDPSVQNDFRTRALWSGAILGPMAALVFSTARHGAPELFEGLLSWWSPALLGATSLCALGALAALWKRWFGVARVMAAGQVIFILIGWSLAQYPRLIIPDITVENARAPEATLRLLLLALGAGALILIPSLVFMLHLFKVSKTPASDRSKT